MGNSRSTEILQADRQAAAWHYIRHEDMKAWLLSWGKEHELPPPKCVCGKNDDDETLCRQVPGGRNPSGPLRLGSPGAAPSAETTSVFLSATAPRGPLRIVRGPRACAA